MPPLIFGVAFGNLLQGVPFQFDNYLVSTYTGSFWQLLNPFALLAGVVSSAMITMHGGVYLAALPDPLGKTVVREAGAWMANYGRIWLLPALGVAGALLAAGFLLARRTLTAFVVSSLAVVGAPAHPARIHLPSLMTALAIMLVGSIYPLLFARADGTADHGLAMALFWAVSAGFGALSTVREIRKRDAHIGITLIAPLAELHYLPGIIWIPSGLRTREQLVVPLANFFKRMNVRHVAAEVTGLREGGRVLETTAGEVLNDALVIASGGRFIKKLPGIEHAITPCEGITSAERIRDRLKAMSGGTLAFGFAGNPNEPSAVRGGPMFEFLFGIDEQLKREGRREQFELVFFNPSREPGNRLEPKAVQHLLAEMTRRNIRTHLGYKLKRFEADKVVTEGGKFKADLILFMPGLTGNVWFDRTDLARSSGGLLKADAQCRVEGTEHIYVVGDSGSFPGPDWMPKQAHMADLQAAAAAENLLNGLRGQAPVATFKIELICIIDAIDHGTLIWRTLQRNVILPSTRLFHWAKRWFEGVYLRKYR